MHWRTNAQQAEQRERLLATEPPLRELNLLRGQGAGVLLAEEGARASAGGDAHTAKQKT